MHLSSSGYGRVDITLGKLSLHWRVDKTTTAVICSPKSDAHSGLLGYAVRRPSFWGSLEHWLQPSSSAYHPESGSEV